MLVGLAMYALGGVVLLLIWWPEVEAGRIALVVVGWMSEWMFEVREDEGRLLVMGT